MSNTFPAREAIQLVDNAAASLVLQETRFIEHLDIGEWSRQGDIYLVKIKEVPAGCKPSPTRQLAPGTTQGSRHIAEGDCDVLVHPQQGRINWTPCSKGGNATGPVIVARGFFTNTHPEHAHISLPAGVYQVYGQIDQTTLQRVQD